MRWHKNVFILLTFLLSLTVINNSEAQTNNSQNQFNNLIEEIVVTATKKETTLQEAPIAISIVSDVEIEQLAISDLIDLQQSVPSLRINQQQFASQNTFLIRGFGNGANNPGVEPAVAVSIDGVMISRNQSALNDLMSLERVEVIKGPQSTLFGKNSSAGVISITTKLPENEFGGKIQITGGDYGLQKIGGTVTGPISENTSFRITASTHERDGYTKNLNTGNEINDRDRYSVRAQLLSEVSDNLTLRLIVDSDSADENCCTTSALTNGAATLGFASVIGPMLGKPVIKNPVDPFGYETYLDKEPRTKIDTSGISFHVDYEMENVKFKSITAYRESEQEVFDGDVDFSAMPLLTNSIADEFETFTQEFRISSNNDSPFQWMIGAFYQDETVNHDRDVLYKEYFPIVADILLGAAGTNLNAVAGGVAVQTLSGISQLPAAIQASLLGFALPPLSIPQIGGVLAGVSTGSPALDAGIAGAVPVLTASTRSQWYNLNDGLQHEYFDMDNESFSIFANLDYDISPNTTVSLGVNYTKDEKTVVSNVIISDTFATYPFILNPATAGLAGLQFFPPFFNYPNENEDGKWDSDDVTHSFKIMHDLDDSLSVYFSHSTGFKAISVNMSANATVFAGLPMDPSIYFADPEEAENFEVGFKKTFSNGYLNLTAFHMTVEGIQNNLFIGTGFNLVNVDEQTHKGIEIDSLFFLSENFVTTFNASYIDAEFGTFKNGPCDPTQLPPAEDNCPIGERVKDFSGRTPGGVPELAFTVSGTYNFDLSNSMSGYIRAEYVYEENHQATDGVPASIASRKVGMINASAGISDENSGINLMLWGRNLNKDEYMLTSFNVPGSPGSWAMYPNLPKMFGITLGKEF